MLDLLIHYSIFNFGLVLLIHYSFFNFGNFFSDFLNFFRFFGIWEFPGNSQIPMGMSGNGNRFFTQYLGVPKYLGILGMGMKSVGMGIPTIGTSLVHCTYHLILKSYAINVRNWTMVVNVKIPWGTGTVLNKTNCNF